MPYDRHVSLQQLQLYQGIGLKTARPNGQGTLGFHVLSIVPTIVRSILGSHVELVSGRRQCSNVPRVIPAACDTYHPSSLELQVPKETEVQVPAR